MTNSKRIESEESLNEGNRFFDFSIDMLAIADYNGFFKRLNPAWTIVLGWSIEELMAKPYLEFVHPEDREPTLAEAKRIAKLGEDCIRFENRYQCKDGSYKWLYWSARPIPEENKIFAIARDVTMQKQLQHDLVTALAEIQDLSSLLPLCAWCKKIRDTHGKWKDLDEFLRTNAGAKFTHGICPNCKSKLIHN